MIRETAAYVKKREKPADRVGILATDGTVSSGLYQKACEDQGIQVVVPTAKTAGAGDEDHL